MLLFAAVACTGSGDTESGDTEVDTTTDSTDSTDDTDPGEGPCATPRVTFTQSDGSKQDVSSFFSSGDYLTLGVPGTLEVCPGTWFARVVLRANVDVVGLGTARGDTVLSGGESGTILDIAGPNVTVNVRNVTLDRGAGLDVEHNSGGGGLYCEQQGKVVVRQVDFTNGVANDGAGLYVRDCDLDVEDARFENNVSEDDGGAITMWSSTGRFKDITVTDNEALDGGAMALFDSTVSVEDAQMSGNKAGNFSAGVWVYNSELTMTDVELSRNVNTGRDFGGGLIVQGKATLTRVSFLNNTAPEGAGVYVYFDGVVDGYSCNFSGNMRDDIFAAAPDGGESLNGGSGFSFHCSENTCKRR